MARFNIMPLMTDALHDVSYMSDECFGKYMRLLVTWWRDGCEPISERKLRAYTNASGEQLECIKDHLTETDDGWVQKKLFEVWEQQIKRSNKAKTSAKMSWQNRRKANAEQTQRERISSDDANAMLSVNRIEDTDVSSISSAPDGAPPEKSVSRETAKARVGATANGTRLSKDWKITDEQLDWAMGAEVDPATDEILREAMTRSEVMHEANKFRDFWHGKTGKDARKKDWDATFRNWIRNACSRRRSPNAGGGSGGGYRGHADPVEVGGRIIGRIENADVF